MIAFPETIPDTLSWRAERAPRGRVWLRYEGDTWSLTDVLEEVDRYAVGLAERGVVSGDRVAVLLGNRPETLFAWFAANALGAIFVPLNPASKAHELGGTFALTEPRVLVVDDDLRPLAAAAPAERPLAIVAPPALARSGGGAPRASVAPDDVAVLLATSGTTGAPKAVMQTHRTYALTSEAFPWWVGLGEDDVLYCPLPLFHINAQAYSTMGALGCGAGLALAPRFASRFWGDIRRHGATEVNAVGAMIHILLATPPGDDRGHGLRLCYSALALPEERHRAFEERFGVAMTVGYGLSETTFGTVWPAERTAQTTLPYGSMGLLRQHPRLGAINRARVVRDDGGAAEDDETGELLLSSPATMHGYFRDPVQTASALDHGWLRTGDLVKRSAAGTYTFVSRKKEVLRRRGENVAAAEIESAIAAHPDVLETAVVGAPSELGEDDIVAFVVPRAGVTIDRDALRAFVTERLADYKVPSRIHVIDALPRTATERVAKHLLREP